MNPSEAIIAAVKAKDAPKVAELLDQDATLLYTKTDDGSLILTAVYYGARDAVQVLLARKPVMNIFEAAAVGDAERMIQLLDVDSSLANTRKDGGTPLHLAAYFGRTEACEILLARGALVNAMSQSTVPYIPSNTALHAATAGSAPLDIVPVLLRYGADPNVFDSAGHTPLYNSAFNGHTDVAGMLLDGGADINLAQTGGTPLHVAEARKHEACAAFLRSRGGTK